MENANVKVPEFEEIETTTEVEEASESSNTGSLLAGIVGGFLAYAMIGGAKKLKTFIIEKRNQKNAEIVDAAETVVEDSDSQPES